MSERELHWLRLVRDLSQRLAGEESREQLLPAILDAAVEITSAERGFLVLVGKNPIGNVSLKVVAARTADREGFRLDVDSVSRTVVERVLSRDERGLVTTSDEDEDVLGVSSVRDRQVVLILCVPMRLRGETRGVIYLDHRVIERAFSEGDLAILRTFADQAALVSLRVARGRQVP